MLVLIKLKRYIIYQDKNAILMTSLNNLIVGINKVYSYKVRDSYVYDINYYQSYKRLILSGCYKWHFRQIDTIDLVYKIMHSVYKLINFTISKHDSKWKINGNLIYFYKTPMIINGIHKYWSVIKID